MLSFVVDNIEALINVSGPSSRQNSQICWGEIAIAEVHIPVSVKTC